MDYQGVILLRKICQRCSKEYKPNSNNQKYCSVCKRNIKSAYSKQWRADNAEHVKAYQRQWCAKKRRLKKLEAKKLRLIAKLQANAAKRQAEQLKRKQLYPTDSFWDNKLNAFAQRM